ncbi:MAG: ABC transporter substrate-binding protein [bacterium]
MKKALLKFGLWAAIGFAVVALAGTAGFGLEFKGKIRMQSLSYTPYVDRGENLKPLTALGEIAKEYMRIHPEVEITFVELPELGGAHYTSWIVTQTVGGTIPEIVFGHATELEQYAPDGWFVDWMPYLHEPNPYIPGNKVWYDIFGKKLVELRRSPDGALWSLPVVMVATIIYYNKDIFSEVGIEKPDTWAEFMTISKKLKDSGHTPLLFDMSTHMHLSWSYRVFLSHFYEPKMPEVDVLGTPEQVSAEEFARAIKKGLLSANDPMHKEIPRIYKEWSLYWQKGFLTPPQPGIFERGETAMWWHGIWQMVPLINDPLRKFEFGTFYCPQITKETSPYASGKPMRMVGGASGEQWAITKSAKDKGLVDLCVDWIRFITVPKNIGRMVSEAKIHAPLILGSEVADELKPFLPQAEAGVSPFIVERFFSTKQRDTWFREMQLFMSGRYNIDQISDRIDKLYKEAADELIEKHKYDQSKW